MSKLLTVLFFSLIVVFVGGFAYLAFTDVPVSQSVVEKETTLDALRKGGDSL